MRLTVLVPIILSLLYVQTCEATTVFRCEDATGRLTFSQHGCPQGQREALQEASNPTPGSDAPVPMAEPPALRERQRGKGRAVKRKETIQSDNLVVVGEKQDGCGNRVVGSERRKAIVQGRVRSGMTVADVESALGRPDRITRRNGELHYQYKADADHGARSVSFDENGCVRGKSGRR